MLCERFVIAVLLSSADGALYNNIKVQFDAGSRSDGQNSNTKPEEVLMQGGRETCKTGHVIYMDVAE